MGYRTITPKDVKNILRNKSPNTCPGEDGLLYGILAKLPTTHHFLATLYNKTDKSGVAMDISTNCYLVLAHKAGDSSDPGNFRMLAMTSCLVKPYHEIKAKRMSSFMVENKYIDTSLQKAYLEGINGCIEHIQVLQQIIQDAKSRKKTVHVSWFDLADAFGSVSHELIPICLEHYNIPAQEITYIVNLYSKLQGKVKCKSWESEIFQFKKGIFQGDNYSPIIFLVVFNPLIDYITKFEETHGYQLGDTKVITNHLIIYIECTETKNTIVIHALSSSLTREV